MLPDAGPLDLAPAEGRNLAPHIPRGQRPRWGWGVHAGVTPEQRGLRAVMVSGGGGSLAWAMRGLQGSGSGLGSGEVKVVHPSGGRVHHGGVVVCLWAPTLTAHLQYVKLMRFKGKSGCLGIVSSIAMPSRCTKGCHRITSISSGINMHQQACDVTSTCIWLMVHDTKHVMV